MEPIDIPPSKKMPHLPANRRLTQLIEFADLVVVGPPSSGTRVATRLMGESGLDVVHDRSHGAADIPHAKVVRIHRDRDIRVASVLARDDMPMFANIATREEAEIFVDVTEELVLERYLSCPALSYEALIADRDAELARIADELGIPQWVSTIAVTDENAKHQIGES